MQAFIIISIAFSFIPFADAMDEQRTQESPKKIGTRFVGDTRAGEMLAFRAGRGHAHEVAWFLQKGANPDATFASFPTLIFAVAQAQDGDGDEDYKQVIVHLLDYGAAINITVNGGSSALHIAAAWSKRSDIVELLLSKGIDVSLIDSKGKTALDYAIKKGNLSIIKPIFSKQLSLTRKQVFTLIKNPQCSLDEMKQEIKRHIFQIPLICIKDDDNNTLLHNSLRFMKIDLALWLLTLEPRMLERENNRGENCVQIAVGVGYSSIISALLALEKDGVKGPIEKEQKCIVL